jgi:hypothetical protein
VKLQRKHLTLFVGDLQQQQQQQEEKEEKEEG